MAEQKQNLDWDKIVNAVVSIGAAVVIFGAWAKILHKSFADVMLTVGLLTEALIFIIYAFYHPVDKMDAVADALKGGIGGGGASPANDELEGVIWELGGNEISGRQFMF
jgi:hypothetical protein